MIACPSLEMIHGEDFEVTHVRQALALDALFYPPENLATLEQCLSWREKNPEIYSGLINFQSRELVGYLNLMPIEPSSLATFLATAFNDIETSAGDLTAFTEPGEYTGYLASMCLAPQYRGRQANGSFLIEELFWRKLHLLKERGILFDSVWGRAVTRPGLRLLKRMGAQEQAPDLFRIGREML